MDPYKKEGLMFVLILLPVFAFSGCALLAREMRRFDRQFVDYSPTRASERIH